MIIEDIPFIDVYTSKNDCLCKYFEAVICRCKKQ